MSDPLLPYYNRELAFIRKMGAEFAQANPRIASRLRMAEGESEDPHVSRMIEAFAYLNARTRHKIEDEFPEISESLLGVLYPHYLAPFPSASIVQFTLDRGQAELTSGHTIPRGSPVETESIDGQPCRFQTRYPVTLWPIQLRSAQLTGPPFPAPQTRFTDDAQAVVRIALECYSDRVAFHQLELDSLRFFLHGQLQYMYDLYEVLLNNTIGVAVAASSDAANVVELNKDCIQPVGFERDQGLLDYTARSFLGYGLLSDYFVFPDKFLFVDIGGLSPQVRNQVGQDRRIELFLYLDRHVQDLERNVNTETFRMGCCPMVNLFQHRAEPIQLTHTEYEYRVVPDARRPLAHEVYSVDRVIATSPDDKQVEFVPFYSIKHHQDISDDQRFWYASRRPAGYAGGEVDRGTEVYLSLVDLGFQPSVLDDWIIDVETTCLNRDLPARLPFGQDQPRLQLATGGPLVKLRCLTEPTRTLRPELGHGTVWRLISHLSLNHISLVDGQNGADALREVLKLYDFTDSAAARGMIDGILNVRSQRVVGRVGGPVSSGFCRGVEVQLHFDEEKFTGGGLYLFASVLERFLGLYTSVNSFTKTCVTTNRREGYLKTWPPRAGERVLA